MPVVCSCCCCFVQCYDIAMRCDYIYGCSNADSIFLAHSPERITTLNAQLYAGLMLFVFCAFFFFLLRANAMRNRFDLIIICVLRYTYSVRRRYDMCVRGPDWCVYLSMARVYDHEIKLCQF